MAPIDEEQTHTVRTFTCTRAILAKCVRLEGLQNTLVTLSVVKYVLQNITVETSVLIFTTTPLSWLYIKFQSTQSPSITEFKGARLIII